VVAVVIATAAVIAKTTANVTTVVSAVKTANVVSKIRHNKKLPNQNSRVFYTD
jgi:hypothetical protein